MIEGLIYQLEHNILNVYAPKTDKINRKKASKHVKQIRTIRIYKSKNIVEDFNSPLPSIHRATKQKSAVKRRNEHHQTV